MDFFTYMAIILGVISVCILVSQLYVKVRSNTLQVGDLVRTSFTGCPAVLTGALWGHGFTGQNAPYYSNSLTYDSAGGNIKPYWSFDAANALHCDVYGAGFSTYSTWISSAGQNFRNLVSLSYLSVTNRYYRNIGTCSSDADCQTNTFIPCGPGYYPPFNNQSLWDSTNFGKNQCPANSDCSLCIGPNGSSAACAAYDATSLETGTCILQTISNRYSCTFVNQGSVTTGKVCSGAIYENTGQEFPHPFRAASCDPANNLSASGRCNVATPPDFCNYNQNGNIDCLYGQQCVTNSNQNWSYNTTDQFICSGTVLPSVVINLDWIAEGVVTSITTGTGTPKYNVLWNRVQNLYNGIGPSPLWCKNGKCQFSLEAVQDTSWQYNDCRFIAQDNMDTRSRHYDVSRALLGTSISNPMGWNVLSVSKYQDAQFIDFIVSSLTMYINTVSTGAIDTSTTFTAGDDQSSRFFNGIGQQPFAATSWNLRGQNLPIEQVQKIYFYSIMPVDFGPPTDGLHYDHVNEFRAQHIRTGGNLRL